jgi:hypothetical protein
VSRAHATQQTLSADPAWFQALCLPKSRSERWNSGNEFVCFVVLPRGRCARPDHGHQRAWSRLADPAASRREANFAAGEVAASGGAALVPMVEPAEDR